MRDLLLVLALVVIMVVSTGVAMEVIEKLAEKLKVQKVFLSFWVIGLAVALPELTIAVVSSTLGQPQLAVGDLVGANIANLSWVIGGAALAGGAIPVVGEFIREDLWITMILALTPFLLMVDGNLSRFDAVVLLFGYVLYMNDLVKKGRFKIRQARTERRSVRTSQEFDLWRSSIKLLLALAILAYAGVKLVAIFLTAAQALGVSSFWMGLTAVAVSTTLPEIVVSFEEITAGRLSLLLSSLLDSVAINSTLVMAIAALITPVQVVESAQRGVAGIFLVAILAMFWIFTKSKRRLDRWEGAVLLGTYLMFIGLQFLVFK